jgi:L-aspartate oxidase
MSVVTALGELPPPRSKSMAGAALAAAAALREETRGSHWREDFPERDDARCSGHFDVVLAEGATTLEFRPADPTDLAPIPAQETS